MRSRFVSSLYAWLSGRPRLPVSYLAWPFVGFALLLTSSSNGIAAIEWMRIYDYRDFSEWNEVWEYMKGLHTGISPFWSFVDLASWVTRGSLNIPCIVLYRAAMLTAFTLPFLLFGDMRARRWGIFLLCFVFLWSAVLIHPGNAQAYDMYFPALILLIVLLLDRLRDPGAGHCRRMALAAAAGLLLSVAELTRPFMLIFLPVLLLLAWLSLRELPRKYFWVMMIPLAILSGGWHARLLIVHGQLNWSNYTGSNLQRCWQKFTGGIGLPSAPPLKEGQWANLNSPQQNENDRILFAAVLRGVIRHPWGAVKHAFHRLLIFHRPETGLYHNHPRHWVLWLYRPAVWITASLLWLHLLALILYLGTGLRRKERWESLGRPAHILLIFAAFNTVALALGDKGEEARFLVSVLPFLACMPGMRSMREWIEGVVEGAGRFAAWLRPRDSSAAPPPRCSRCTSASGRARQKDTCIR